MVVPASRGYPGLSTSDAPITVLVFNNTGENVTARAEQAIGNPREIQVWLERAGNESIRNGALDGSLNRRFGLRPTGI